MPEFTDEAAVQAFREGHEDAFEGLIAKYEGTVTALARWLLGPDAEGCRVTEQVFVRAVNDIRDDAIDGRFSNWVFATTLEEISAVRYEQLLNEAKQLKEGIVAPLGSEKELIDEISDDCVSSAIARLPFEYRKIYLLRDVYRVSTRDISEIVNRPHEDIRTILHRSRLMLRRLVVRERQQLVEPALIQADETPRLWAHAEGGDLEPASQSIED